MARLLVVEEDHDLNESMTGIMEAAGHSVESCRDTLEALGQIYSSKYDLVIVDLVTPPVNGARLLKAYRENQPKGMAIIIGDRTDLDWAPEAIRYGAFDFIQKPFEEKELLNTVESALDEARSMRESGFVYKDVHRKDKRLAGKGLIYALSDSILVALSFFLVFLALSFISPRLHLPFFLGRIDLLQMSASLGFCYAFVFVYKKCHRVDLIEPGRDLALHLWRNLSMAYIVFLAILFAAKDFHVTSERVGVLVAYPAGLIFLLVNRIFVLTGIFSLFGREGKKRLVIAGTRKAEAEISGRPRLESGTTRKAEVSGNRPASTDAGGTNTLVIASEVGIDRMVISQDIDELHVHRDSLSPDDIIALLGRLKGRKLKIVLHGERENYAAATDATSHIT